MRESNSLSQKVARGGMWVFALRIVGRIFDLIRIIILARILVPNDFGLIGIALLAMATLETFSQTGFQQALIQKKGDIRTYLNAAWTVLILRGFILFAILYFIAPYAAIFFKAPEAKSIIQVIGLSVLLQAFTNIGVIYFQKELKFNKQFIYQLSGTLADFSVAVSAALILRNAWALIFGLLAGNFVSFIVSYLIHPYRPHFDLDLMKAKGLFDFGRWVFGSSILIFLITQGDDIFVGKLLGVTMLGFYQMAYRISNMPATEITHVISQVTFPAYSKLQDNIPKLREAYLKVLQLTAFLSFPIAGLIFILAPDFTKIFLGAKWMPMVPAMQVLCIFGVARSIVAISGSIFQSVGKPKLLTQVSFAQLIILLSIIYPLTLKYNILGTSMAVVIAMILVQSWTIIQTAKIIDEKLIIILKTLSLPILGALATMASIYLIKTYLLAQILLTNLLLLILCGVIIYLRFIILLKKDIIIEVRNLTKSK